MQQYLQEQGIRGRRQTELMDDIYKTINVQIKTNNLTITILGNGCHQTHSQKNTYSAQNIQETGSKARTEKDEANLTIEQCIMYPCTHRKW